jgi:parallel beta-helix repeat protein
LIGARGQARSKSARSTRATLWFWSLSPSSLLLQSLLGLGAIKWLVSPLMSPKPPDYFGNIVIDADDVTLDGNGHMIIGPGTDFLIWDPNTKVMSSNTGILLEGRTGVTVKNCRVTGFDEGFCLDGSDGNTLQGNTVTDYCVGFVLSSSSNNTLLNNTANGNGEGDDPPNGFQLGRSFGNTIQGNTVNGNGIGFALEESDDNIFFHNNLIDNTIQAAFQPGDSNTWDNGYPSGGNYWSDYKGVDANGDGIGDTPYVIDENNMDSFPLTAPTSVFDDGTKGGE